MDLKLKNKVVLVSGDEPGIADAVCRLLSGEGAMPVMINPGNAEDLQAAVDMAVRAFSRIDGLVNTGDYPNYLSRYCFPLLKKSGGDFVCTRSGDDVQPYFEGVRCHKVGPVKSSCVESVAAWAVFLLSPVAAGHKLYKRPYKKPLMQVTSPGHEPPD